MFGRRIIMTMGTLPTGHIRDFHSTADIGSEARKLFEVENDRSETTTSILASHLINTRLGAHDKPKAVSIKGAPLGHPPLALAAFLSAM
jgi:hypothetical protein